MFCLNPVYTQHSYMEKIGKKHMHDISSHREAISGTKLTTCVVSERKQDTKEDKVHDE